jgi:hypothetical protein
MLWVLLVAPCGEIQETNSSNKKGFREEALFFNHLMVHLPRKSKDVKIL